MHLDVWVPRGPGPLMLFTTNAKLPKPPINTPCDSDCESRESAELMLFSSFADDRPLLPSPASSSREPRRELDAEPLAP